MGTYETQETHEPSDLRTFVVLRSFGLRPTACSGPSACGLRHAQGLRPAVYGRLKYFGSRWFWGHLRNSSQGHRLEGSRQPWRAPSTGSGPTDLRQAQVVRPTAYRRLRCFGLSTSSRPSAKRLPRNSILGHRLDKSRQPWRARSTGSGPFDAEGPDRLSSFAGIFSPAAGHEPFDELKVDDKRSASNGCPTWIRTMTRRVKVACATITPSGSDGRKGHGALFWGLVKA